MSRRSVMTALVTKTIQQIKGIIVLGGLALLAIPVVLILSGTVFIAVFIGLGIFVAAIAWKRLQWIRIKISEARRSQLW